VGFRVRGRTHPWQSGRVKDYTELADLKEIYLEDSWVLGIVAEPGEICFRVDFVLTERHPVYSRPKPDEQYCYRRGILVFEKVSKLVWTEQGSPPARDATGEIDFGNIDAMTFQDDAFELEGDWGSMKLTSASVRINLAADGDPA
jgi:hypothetical protein